MNEEQFSPEELELGINASELFASVDEKELEIVHNGKKWIFKYRDLSWKEKYDCVDAATSLTGDDFGFSLGKYYIIALTKMLTSSPITPLTETTISKLDKDVGAQLLAIVPNPSDPTTIGNIKKE